MSQDQWLAVNGTLDGFTPVPSTKQWAPVVAERMEMNADLIRFRDLEIGRAHV